MESNKSNIQYNKKSNISNSAINGDDNVKRVSLEEESGNNIIIIMGKCGSGKSFILDTLSQADSKADLKGLSNFIKTNDFANKSIDQIKIGYCPEYASMLHYLTVKENLEYYLGLQANYDRHEIPEIVGNHLNQFNLLKFQDTKCENLSDGIKKIVKLSIAFLGNPNIILIDDLSSQLDPCEQNFIWNLLSNKMLNKNMKILISSNSLTEFLTLSNKIQFINNGLFEERISSDKICEGLEVKLLCKYAVCEYTEYQITDYLSRAYKDEYNTFDNDIDMDTAKGIFDNEFYSVPLRVKSDFEKLKNDFVNYLIALNEYKKGNKIQMKLLYKFILPIRYGFSVLKEYWDYCCFRLNKEGNKFIFFVEIKKSCFDSYKITHELFKNHVQKMVNVYFIKPSFEDCFLSFIKCKLNQIFNITRIIVVHQLSLLI